MTNRTCPVCSSEVIGPKGKIYCSGPCKDKGKPSVRGLTCYVCGLFMVKSSTSKPQGLAAHNACLKVCDECGRLALARNKCPTHYGYLWRSEFRSEHGYSPRSGGGAWIDPKRRHAIYARDGWTCYLCDELLSVDTPVFAPNALTLDHLHPRSKGGSNDSGNLKTCCRDCNNRKQDKEVDRAKEILAGRL